MVSTAQVTDEALPRNGMHPMHDRGPSGRRFKSHTVSPTMRRHAHGAAKVPKLERVKLRINASPPPELWLRARIMNEQWILSFRRICVSQVVLGEAGPVQGSV